jgi:hypothetical protein
MSGMGQHFVAALIAACISCFASTITMPQGKGEPSVNKCDNLKKGSAEWKPSNGSAKPVPASSRMTYRTRKYTTQAIGLLAAVSPRDLVVGHDKHQGA